MCVECTDEGCRQMSVPIYTSACRMQRLHQGVVSEVHEGCHSPIVLAQHSQHVRDAQLVASSALRMAIHIHIHAAATCIAMSVVDITQRSAPLVVHRTLLLLAFECVVVGALCPPTGRGSSSSSSGQVRASLLPIMRRGCR